MHTINQINKEINRINNQIKLYEQMRDDLLQEKESLDKLYSHGKARLKVELLLKRISSKEFILKMGELNGAFERPIDEGVTIQ